MAELETLYPADRIILFLQLVLKCQCDSRMNIQELWWCYILNVPKYKKKEKEKNSFCTIWALFKTEAEDWDSHQAEQSACMTICTSY